MCDVDVGGAGWGASWTTDAPDTTQLKGKSLAQSHYTSLTAVKKLKVAP